MGGQKSCITQLFAFHCSRNRGRPLEEDGQMGGGCFFGKQNRAAGRPRLPKSSVREVGASGGSSGVAVVGHGGGGNKWLQTATRKRWKPGLESIVEDELLVALVDQAGEMPPSPSHVFLSTTTATAMTKKKKKKKKPKPSAPRKPPLPVKRPSTGQYAKINRMYERRPPLHSAYPLGILF